MFNENLLFVLFQNSEQNVDYEERESEFDITDEDRSPARAAQDNEDEDVEVDVTTSHPTAMYLSRYVFKSKRRSENFKFGYCLPLF